jgi:hypothetical protein
VGGRRCRRAHAPRADDRAGQQGLLGLPAHAFPAQLEVQRVVGRSTLVAFEGNHYSVSPGLAGQTVTVTARLGELHVEILSAAGRRVARHRMPGRSAEDARDRMRRCQGSPPRRSHWKSEISRYLRDAFAESSTVMLRVVDRGLQAVVVDGGVDRGGADAT